MGYESEIMSSDIIYEKLALKLSATQYGTNEDQYLIIEQAGSSNCYEYGNGSGGCGRRSRSWQARAFGTAKEVMLQEVRGAANCAGDGIKNRVMTNAFTPSSYIKKSRKLLTKAINYTVGDSFWYKDGSINCVPTIERVNVPDLAEHLSSDKFKTLGARLTDNKANLYNEFKIRGPECR